ncbi:hypothetical protein ACTSEZ_05685 [Metabacillus sp. JX24]|uniref:hypothetical protein n=1 Tax=Metabacillus sp. JX24 TaxID=3240759 RepID=UPI00350EF240
MMKHLLLLFSLPFLVSLDPLVYDTRYQASYQSPEGIMFLSYSDEWDEENLKELYKELIQNKHGKEISLLQEVRIQGDSLNGSATKGRFHALTDTITLYKGDTYTNVSSYRDTLSHEYGHHFAYHYIKSHHFPFSEWSKLRGLEDAPVLWDAFWNYSDGNHMWYPQEIMADDYVLLYGSGRKTSKNDLLSSNEPFYQMTQHENKDLPNVLENKELIDYLEKETGVTPDRGRILTEPQLKKVQKDKITFAASDQSQVAIKADITYFQDGVELASDEKLFITSKGAETFNIPLNDAASSLEVTFKILDLQTSAGFETPPEKFHVDSLLSKGQ